MVQEAVPSLAGFAVNVNDSRTNTVLGKTTKVLWGEAFLEETIGDFASASAHRFLSSELNDPGTLVNKAVLWTKPKPDHDVLDLFCGVGTFSIPLAQHAKTVTGVEEMLKPFDGVAKR